MKTFVLKVNPNELWRCGPNDGWMIEGVAIRAFTPFGAGHKAKQRKRNGRYFNMGLKNCIVLDGDTAYSPFYPAQPSLMSLLDAPLTTLYYWRNIFR